MFIIIVRLNSKQLVSISADEFGIAEYDTYEEAEELITSHPLANQDWEIIEVSV